MNALPPIPVAPSGRLSARLRRRIGRLLGARAPALQVAALCRDAATGRILMITSRGTGRWIIPKGWPMPGRSLVGAALQEAWEEAGVRATPGLQLGIYHYEKMQDHGFAIPVEVTVFLACVAELSDDYPEAGKRRRQWFDPAEAAGLVAEPELAALIRRLPAGDQGAGGPAEAGAPAKASLQPADASDALPATVAAATQPAAVQVTTAQDDAPPQARLLCGRRRRKPVLSGCSNAGAV